MGMISVLLLALIATVSVSAQDITNKIVLTEQEQNWINEHPVIKVSNNTGYAPIDFVSAGAPAGLSIDYMKMIGAKVGLKIDFVNYESWSKSLEEAQNKNIDLIHTISINEERQKYFIFSPSYFRIPIANYGRVGSQRINSIDDLEDKRIGLIKGYIISDTYREKFPQFTYVEFENDLEALEALSLNKIDVFTGQVTVFEFIISQNNISGIEIVGDDYAMDYNVIDQHIAVHKDNPVLMDIINKGMAAISSEEFMVITEKWATEYQSPKDIDLTMEERQWLAANNTIRVAAESNLAPYEFVNERGEISGVSGSYLSEISKLLNVDFVWSENQTWVEAFEQINSGQADMLSAVTPTIDREKFLTFTDSYNSLFLVIFARDGGVKFSSMNNLEGYSVAQIAGSITANFIKEDYPDIKLVEVDSVTDVLQLLSTGNVDAYIGDIPSTADNIATTGLSNISVVGITDYQTDNAMGIRKDLPLLGSAMQKAMKNISDQQRAEISAQWLTVKMEENVNYDLIVKILLVGLVIIAIIFIWANSLRAEIKRREVVEKKLRLSQAEAEAANAAKSTFLANMSHEIRTPLNAIIGFSEIMSSGIYGQIEEPKYKGYLYDIIYSGQHLETVINDILDLSKIEAGKWQLDEEEFDLYFCTEEAMTMLRPSSDEKNINLDIASNSISGINILGDINAIRRILLNLLSNAIKFTENGGQVNVLISKSENNDVNIEIKDTGIGIPADRIEHVVSPFVQISGDETLNEAGTGLGLSIVNQLTKLHGGKFILSSEVGVGTSATILIPAFRFVQ